jgi:hypothetical protein
MCPQGHALWHTSLPPPSRSHFFIIIVIIVVKEMHKGGR